MAKGSFVLYQNQEEHVRLHRALDELVACYLTQNMGMGLPRTENGLGSVHNRIIDLMTWAHQKTMTPSDCTDQLHPRTTFDFEGERQLICLALACLALARPGLDAAIRDIAKNYDVEGLPTYESLKQSNADRIKPLGPEAKF